MKPAFKKFIKLAELNINTNGNNTEINFSISVRPEES